MGSKNHRRKSKAARREHAQATGPTETQPPAIDVEVRGASEATFQQTVETVVAEMDGDLHGNSKRDTVQLVAGDHEFVSVAYADAIKEPSCSPSDPPLPVEEARRVLERLFVAMLAAGLSPSQALTSSTSVLVDDLIEQLESQERGEPIALTPLQRNALAAVINANDGNDGVNVTPLDELASAATFRVEMLEFQIRQAILDRAGSKSRAKVDVQRVLTKIASSLPSEETLITSKAFDSILEEKLGVSTGSTLLTNVVFARLTNAPFAHTLPKHLVCAHRAFFAALEAFVIDKPLSLDSVEGQLRHLVASHADLRARFQTLDTDHSGSISVDEFVTFLEREAHMHYPRAVLLTFIQRFDVDGDGTLSYEEFVAFVNPKQFGVQVLTPFGMFYQSADRHEVMRDVVAKIKTRMFWMQHNDLFATSTQSVSNKQPLKLKVTDHFVLTHHYGTLRLQFKPSDPIAKVLKNGEMVVVVLTLPGANIQTTVGHQFPRFEYRLKPAVKRSLPPLLSWSFRQSMAMREQAIPLLIPPSQKTVCAKTSAPRRATALAKTRNSLVADEGATVASSIPDATSCPSTIRCMTKSSGRLRHVAIEGDHNTEPKRAQKGPLKTQSQSESSRTTSDRDINGSSSSPTLTRTSSIYEYFEPATDDDEEEEDAF